MSHPRYVLGLFGPGPNPSATLLRDGSIVAIVEEERLNRIKTAPNAVPTGAARECLRIGGITLDDVTGIAYGWDCERYAETMPAINEQTFAAHTGVVDDYSRLHADLLVNLYHPVRIRRSIQLGLSASSRKRTVPPVTFFPHHLCHAASAFYCSGFDEANILTIDASGEELSTMLAAGRGSEIEVIEQIALPHTLGGFYATFTEFVGFIPNQDEGKLMGLASYGKYDQAIQDKLDRVIRYDPVTGDFTVDPSMRYFGDHTYGRQFTDRLVDLFGPPRDCGRSALDAPYPDIAFGVQWRLEQIVTLLAANLAKRTGLRNLCLAGGVAMNCVMNGKLADEAFAGDVFVQPAAADNGASLGAALLLAKQHGSRVTHKMEHAYWGPAFDDGQIEQALKEAKIDYRRSGDVSEEVAAALERGAIVGWFQGRMEVGARALGGRSILANPLLPEMKDRLNLEVKHREHWRPFCPSMTQEAYDRIIGSRHDSPFMILAFPVVEAYRDSLPSVVHVDGTARPQIVKEEHSPAFFTLLKAFERRTGHAVLVNTSFNVQGEPIVCTPRDAIRCFGATGIDLLAIGSFIAEKPGRAR